MNSDLYNLVKPPVFKGFTTVVILIFKKALIPKLLKENNGIHLEHVGM